MPKYVQYSNYLLQRRANIKLYSWKLRAYQAILNLENNVQIQFTFQETHVKPETNNKKTLWSTKFIQFLLPQVSVKIDKSYEYITVVRKSHYTLKWPKIPKSEKPQNEMNLNLMNKPSDGRWVSKQLLHSLK